MWNDLEDCLDTTSSNTSTFTNLKSRHMKPGIIDARRTMTDECQQGTNMNKRRCMMDLQNRRPYEDDDHQKTCIEPKGDGDRIGAGFMTKQSTIRNTVLDMYPRNLIPNVERDRDTNELDPRWKHPFTAIVAGPTGCGKTVFTLKFITLASEMITPVPEKIIWCYGVYQDEFDKYPDIDFREGLPDPNTFDGRTKTLLVIDDLMSETDESVTKIFTKISHHRSVSVLYLSQNLFFSGKTK